MTERITKRLVEAITPTDKDLFVWDADVKGFGLKVTPVGNRVFLFQYRMAGRGSPTKRLTIGRFASPWSVEKARDAARDHFEKVRQGIDPQAEKAAAQEAAKAAAAADELTLRVLVQDWLSLGLVGRKESYRKEAVRAITTVFAGFLDRRADALTKGDAVRVLDALVKDGKHAMAGRTLAYARACYGWALKRDRVQLNPFNGLPVPAAIVSRDRVLTEEEVGAIYSASIPMGYPFGPLIRLLMLTGQRREEVGGLRWSELSDDGATWVLPASRAKNNKEHVVHLSDEARAVLAECPRQAGTDFVFTTTGRTPVSGFSKASERLTAAAEAVSIERAEKAGKAHPVPMPDWRLHDFRRTCVTWLAGAGFSPHVADKLLNHVSAGGLSDVGRVYQRNAFLPERKAALEAWGRHVLACANADVGTTCNVIAIKR